MLINDNFNSNEYVAKIERDLRTFNNDNIDRNEGHVEHLNTVTSVTVHSIYSKTSTNRLSIAGLK